MRTLLGRIKNLLSRSSGEEEEDSLPPEQAIQTVQINEEETDVLIFVSPDDWHQGDMADFDGFARDRLSGEFDILTVSRDVIPVEADYSDVFQYDDDS